VDEATVEAVEHAEPRISEFTANGLTWIHFDRPCVLEAAALAERFGFHELDIEDVLSKRQRLKIDEYRTTSSSSYDKAVQRLNATELDVFGARTSSSRCRTSGIEAQRSSKKLKPGRSWGVAGSSKWNELERN
jgi:hypothetical protein